MSTVISITVSTKGIAFFYQYALAMLQSMKDNANINVPIIIHYDAMTETQRDILKVINPNVLEFRKIPIDEYIKYDKNSGGWFVLEGWSLKEYDKVIILDSDFICQGDLNYLVDFDGDIGMCREPSGLFNGGLVVVSKKILNEDWYFKMLSCRHDWIRLGRGSDAYSKDQKLINYFLGKRITKIDNIYNCVIGEKNAIDAKMVHYIYKTLYPEGRKQLEENNPEFIEKWESYYNKAIKVINGL